MSASLTISKRTSQIVGAGEFTSVFMFSLLISCNIREVACGQCVEYEDVIELADEWSVGYAAFSDK